MMKNIFIIIILCVLITTLDACVTGGKYYTYQLKSNVRKERERLSFWRNSYDSEDFLAVNYYSGDNSKTIAGWLPFRYIINNKTRLDNGDYTTTNKEPYDLITWIPINGNPKKIIFNKMIFRSKNHVIDLREKIEIFVSNFNSFELSEEEYYNFRNFGLIDIDILRERRDDINWLELVYRDVDVKFNKDLKFTIEYDITIENDDATKINIPFIAKFNRKKIIERSSIWGLMFLSGLLSLL